MTTVVVDIKNKIAYSDSRVTNTNLRTGEVSYERTKDKIVMNVNKKSLCVFTGNVALIRSKVKNSGFKKAFKDSCGTYESGESCHIIVLQKDSKLATVVTGRVIMDKVTWEYKTFSGDYIYTGSGSSTKEARKISRYLSSGLKIPCEKIIEAASYSDKHTDDNVRKVCL